MLTPLMFSAEIEIAPEVMVPPVIIIDPSLPLKFCPLIVIAESIIMVPLVKLLEERTISASLIFPIGILLFWPAGLLLVF